MEGIQTVWRIFLSPFQLRAGAYHCLFPSCVLSVTTYSQKVWCGPEGRGWDPCLGASIDSDRLDDPFVCSVAVQ